MRGYEILSKTFEIP